MISRRTESRFFNRNIEAGFATLFVSLVMIILVTAIVLAAYTMSTVNLRSVNNLQFRSEAIAAANRVLRNLASTDVTTITASQQSTIDVDENGSVDYQVVVDIPQCIRADLVSEDLASSVTLPADMSTGQRWNTLFELVARVNGLGAATGTAVTVRQGVRMLLSPLQKASACNGG